VLEDSYEKLVFACTDRNLEFHTKFGRHYKTRVPKIPRDLSFNRHQAVLSVGCSGDEVFRLDLEQGKFLAPFQTSSPDTNALAYNPRLSVLLAGGEQGVEIWDCRERKAIAVLGTGEATALECDPGGLLFATGGPLGQVAVWDIRHSRAVNQMQHPYREAVHSVKFHTRGRKVVSASRLVINLYHRDSGAFFTSIEPKHMVNRIELAPESGLILAAQETERVGAFFIPALDKAPSWLPYLDNMTEEMELERSTAVYDQYKFLLPEEVEDLGCQALVGSPSLKVHLHGYLMPLRLYRKLEHKSSRRQFA
jgi:ribosome biogenesis protein ENP2